MSDNSVAVKVVQEFWETFGNKHDVEAAAAFVDPDVVRRGPIPDPEEKDNCRGKDNYVTFLNHVVKVIPNYHVGLFRIFAMRAEQAYAESARSVAVVARPVES